MELRNIIQYAPKLTYTMLHKVALTAKVSTPKTIIP